MKRQISNTYNPSSRRCARVMKVFNLVLIILLVGCLFQTGKVNATEISVSESKEFRKPLNMICKSIGIRGFTVDNKDEYKPANFKSETYIVVDKDRKDEKWKDILKILIFKNERGVKINYRCKNYYYHIPLPLAYECIARSSDIIILNKLNLRYTKISSGGWPVFYGDDMYIEYGNCSRVE